ncbi:MAG: DUF423 domain-containing protein [Ignavibacteriales bacterium]|nr:DUF423 domain-containing protein [Ignavibacteriales bacterium]MBP9119900.1 DUF423 domain-containing protein [Ignavibacterium sp.]
MNDKKLWLIISAVSGFTAVSIGAFGAHGLRETLTPQMLEVYKTGVLYQLIHSVVLLALTLNTVIKAKLPSIFFLLGIMLFSFSLYIYSTSGIRLFAMITPIGGFCFLIGWLLIIYETIRLKP